MSSMNQVFADTLYTYVIVYLDDILVYSSAGPEHLNHLREALKRL